MYRSISDNLFKNSCSFTPAPSHPLSHIAQPSAVKDIKKIYKTENFIVINKFIFFIHLSPIAVVVVSLLGEQICFLCKLEGE